jgi:acyl-CoA thioester hydrolase
MKLFKTHTRVRYAETDAAGIVYYNNFFVYFELGRIEMFRQLGIPYTWRLPIAETYCRYHASARFDDLLEIQTSVTQLRSKGFRIGCKVYCIAEGEVGGGNQQSDGPGNQPVLLAEGYTAMITVGDDHRPIELPEAFKKAFGRD